jgi:hypothetical protein
LKEAKRPTLHLKQEKPTAEEAKAPEAPPPPAKPPNQLDVAEALGFTALLTAAIGRADFVPLARPNPIVGIT